MSFDSNYYSAAHTMSQGYKQMLLKSWGDLFSLITLKGVWNTIKIAVICLLLLWIAEACITKTLDLINEYIDESLHHDRFGIVFVVCCIVFSICLIHQYKKYRFHISNSYISWWLAYAVAYVFFRFVSNHYVFWSFRILGISVVYLDFSLLPLLTIIVFYIWGILNGVYQRIRLPIDDNVPILRDDAITVAGEDLLGFNRMAITLLFDLTNVNVSQHSYSVGITGEWGIGKSSFLNIVESFIPNSDPNAILIRFYPRSSSRLDMVQDDFFKSFSSAVNPYDKSFPKLVSRYIRALKILDGEGVITKVANALETLHIEDEKDKINDTLQNINRRIYVIIEDLDRLTGPEILEVFKLIDRNGNFQNVIYLSAYDKDYVNNVLNHMLNYGSNQCYSDKYFSYEFSLPSPRNSIINNYISGFIRNNVIHRYSVSDFDINFNNEWERVGDTVCLSLTSIRHAKRFINLFTSRYLRVPAEVNIGDFLLLTLIRYKNLAVYNAISKGIPLFKGGFLSGSSTTLYLKKDYESMLKIIGADDEILNIVSILFPKGGNEDSGNSKYKLIRRSQSFDFYFSIPGKSFLLHKDIIPIYILEDDDEALDVLTKLLGSKSNWDMIEEYLRYSDFDYITKSKLIGRYIKLVILAYHLTGRSINYYATFGHLFYKSAKSDITKHLSDGDTINYGEILYASINQMIDRCSLSIGLMINNFLQGFKNNPSTINDCVFTSKQFVDIALKCQKFYTEHSGGFWQPQASIELSLIFDSDKAIINSMAQKYIIHQFYLHPEEYAKVLLRTNVSLSGNNKMLYISFASTVMQLFGNLDNDFKKWIQKIPDADMKFVYSSLLDANLRGETIAVPAIQDSYYQYDYKGFRKAIERSLQTQNRIQNLNDDCKAVYGLLNNSMGLTFAEIVKSTQLPEDSLHNALSTLSKLRLIRLEGDRKNTKYFKRM